MTAPDRLDLMAVAELLVAARNASATLAHAYHTTLTGKLADYAHDDYQRLDAAISRVQNGPSVAEAKLDEEKAALDRGELELVASKLQAFGKPTALAAALAALSGGE